MSIYASIPGIDADTPTGPPWLYRGSHLLPTVDDPRGGSISLALIPAHITPTLDDADEDGPPLPWLRVSTDAPDTLINPAQARHLADQLTYWADQAQPQTTGNVRDEDIVTLRDALGAVTGQCRALEADLVAARSTIDRVRNLADKYQTWHEGGWAPEDAGLVAREYRDALDQPQEPGTRGEVDG